MAKVHLALDSSKRAKDCQKMVGELSKADGKMIKFFVMDLIEKSYKAKFGADKFKELTDGN